MRFFVNHPNGRLFHCSRVILLLVAIAGCVPEEISEPTPAEPEPVLPSLVCAPFVKTGYTDKVSYFPGEKMKIFFDSKETVSLCRITVYDVNGDSVLSAGSELPTVPTLLADASQNGFNFPVAVEFTLPEMASGVYLIEKKIPFIVKTKENVDVIIVYPSNTANAYANAGGESLYSPLPRSGIVSFHRPIPLQAFSVSCLQWFTSLEGMRLGYIADIDMDRFENIQKARVIVVPGHSEYWSRHARLNFDRFVDSGNDALILSGNTMWWQVRYSGDESQLICHKDATLDPFHDALFKTIEWSTPSLQYSILSSIGAHFPLGGYGQRSDYGWDGFKIVQPASPLFEGLNLKRGDIISLPTVEYDGAPVAGQDQYGYPLVDNEALGFNKIELLGFDKGFRGVETTATFIVFQKSPTSGIIVNTASTDWCSASGMGGTSGTVIKKITHNALIKLLNNDRVFSN